MSATAIGTAEDREIRCTTLPAPTVPMSIRSLLQQRIARLKLDKTISAELRHDILLTVSELVTNAGTATPHSAITFRAVFEDRCVWVGVWDASDEKPTPRAVVTQSFEDITPDPHALDEGHQSDEIGGLGLPLVMALTRDRGIEPTSPHGKWIWARFHYRPATGREHGRTQERGKPD